MVKHLLCILTLKWCSNHLLFYHDVEKHHEKTSYLIFISYLGNVQSMLSKPDNADITEYQQYRQSYNKYERSQSRPSTPVTSEGALLTGAAGDMVSLGIVMEC